MNTGNGNTNYAGMHKADKVDKPVVNTAPVNEEDSSDEAKTSTDVVENSKSENKNEEDSILVKVTAHTLNLRANAVKTGKRLGYLHKGDILEVNEIVDEDWYHVTTEAGKEGFVMSEFTEEA